MNGISLMLLKKTSKEPNNQDFLACEDKWIRKKRLCDSKSIVA